MVDEILRCLDSESGRRSARSLNESVEAGANNCRYRDELHFKDYVVKFLECGEKKLYAIVFDGGLRVVGGYEFDYDRGVNDVVELAEDELERFDKDASKEGLSFMDEDWWDDVVEHAGEWHDEISGLHRGEEDERTCEWCGGTFSEEDMADDPELGYVCRRCASGISSREGRTLGEGTGHGGRARACARPSARKAGKVDEGGCGRGGQCRIEEAGNGGVEAFKDKVRKSVEDLLPEDSGYDHFWYPLNVGSLRLFVVGEYMDETDSNGHKDSFIDVSLTDSVDDEGYVYGEVLANTSVRSVDEVSDCVDYMIKSAREEYADRKRKGKLDEAGSPGQDAMAKSDDPAVRAGLADATDRADLLERLSGDDNPEVRRSVAMNSNTPAPILKNLMNDPDGKVASAARYTASGRRSVSEGSGSHGGVVSGCRKKVDESSCEIYLKAVKDAVDDYCKAKQIKANCEVNSGYGLVEMRCRNVPEISFSDIKKAVEAATGLSLTMEVGSEGFFKEALISVVNPVCESAEGPMTINVAPINGGLIRYGVEVPDVLVPLLEGEAVFTLGRRTFVVIPGVGEAEYAKSVVGEDGSGDADEVAMNHLAGIVGRHPDEFREFYGFTDEDSDDDSDVAQDVAYKIINDADVAWVMEE